MTKLLSFFGGWQGYAAAAALAASLAAFSSWYVTDAVMGRTLATERAAHAEQQRLQAEAARAETERHRALEAALWGHITDIQTKAEKDAEDDRKTAERLGADLDAGAVRLRLAAICPAAAAGGTAADPAGTGLCAGTAVERAAALRRAVFHIRDAIARDARTIRACQGAARAVRAAVAGQGAPPR